MTEKNSTKQELLAMGPVIEEQQCSAPSQKSGQVSASGCAVDCEEEPTQKKRVTDSINSPPLREAYDC
eukprot:729530-Amphidinium_carterae.1